MKTCVIILFSLISTTSTNAQTTKVFDVVIDEILADPTPVVGLPAAEFIEIKNISGKDIDLTGWVLRSLSSSSKPFPSCTLPSDSFLIITAFSNVDLFSSFGKVIGISSFPALNNEGTTLSLASKEGFTVHAVNYKSSWYKNDVKSNGGWSLEMIDTDNACGGENNWKASTDAKGGTPGSKNSVDALNPDITPPSLISAAAIDSTTVVLTFNEPLDSFVAANASNYAITQGIVPLSALPVAPIFSQIQLTLNTPVIRGKVYTITANNITDCSGNVIEVVKTARVGLPEPVDSGDIVINEILFNPKPDEIDYVEIYNRSDKILNLKDLLITNRSLTTHELGTLKRLSTTDILLFPKDYFVVSENGTIVKQNFFAKNPNNFIDVAMPSLPNDEGVAVVLNKQKQIIDELHYFSKWHFALIDNEKGISLERIDYNKPTQNKDNWTSAASTAGFGTPSYQNSQLNSEVSLKANITVSPKTFSPDKDGFEDFTTINYQMTEPGFVANITIFDAEGRPVKNLVKNATLALSGSFKWYGLDDKFNKVPTGVYVIYTEVFNLNGKKKSFKNAVIVAARL